MDGNSAAKVFQVASAALQWPFHLFRGNSKIEFVARVDGRVRACTKEGIQQPQVNFVCPHVAAAYALSLEM